MWRIAYVAIAACGRIGFAPAGDGGDAGEPHRVDWVQVFVTSGTDTGNADTFTAAALHAGDAILIHAYCLSSTRPTAVSITAAGWTFAPLAPIDGSAANRDWAVAFGAIAPDTAPHAIEVAWTGCASGTATLGDEFTNNAPAPFYAATTAFGIGDCSAATVVATAGDAVWGGCSALVTGTGTGFAKGADDQSGDWTEHATTEATGELPVTFANTSGATFILTTAAIR